MDTQEVLDKLFSEQKVKVKNGQYVKVRKVNVRSLGPVLKLIAAAAEGIGKEGLNLEGLVSQAGQLRAAQQSGAILKLISNNYDLIAECVLVLTDVRDLTVLENMELDDFVTIVQAIIVVNREFFAKNVIPALGLWAGERVTQEESDLVMETALQKES